MTVAKVIEINSESSVSFEDAIRLGIAKAAESVHDIKGAWVQGWFFISDEGVINMKVAQEKDA